jgi:type IV pilus assembly protein PilF
MTQSTVSLGLTSGWSTALTKWAAVLCVCLLGACANTNQSRELSAKGDIITESDETDLRKRARLRLELASGYFEQGQLTVALDEVKQALVFEPNSGDALNLRGLIYMNMGEKALAEESFKRALSVSGNNPEVLHNFGWMLCQERRFPEAFIAFEQALANAAYRNPSRTRMTLGVCQVRAGRAQDAERTFARAYELDPGNPVVAFNLARLLHERGDNQRVQFIMSRLNATELANAETLWLSIKTEFRLGNMAEADRWGEQLRKRFPDSKQAQAFAKRDFND